MLVRPHCPLVAPTVPDLGLYAHRHHVCNNMCGILCEAPIRPTLSLHKVALLSFTASLIPDSTLEAALPHSPLPPHRGMVLPPPPDSARFPPELPESASPSPH